MFKQYQKKKSKITTCSNKCKQFKHPGIAHGKKVTMFPGDQPMPVCPQQEKVPK